MTDAMASQFAGRIALVTGAGRGIGAGIAEVLSTRGAAVAVCDLDEKTAEETANSINEARGKAIFGAVDVTDPASPEKSVRGCLESEF